MFSTIKTPIEQEDPMTDFRIVISAKLVFGCVSIALRLLSKAYSFVCHPLLGLKIYLTF